MLPKIRITSEKASNESCSELTVIQESPQAHMSTPLRVVLGGGGGVVICACSRNCSYKIQLFNSKQLSFEAFFYMMRIFGSIEP